MKYAVIIARIILGGGFLVFGLNHFLNFFPPPQQDLPENAAKFGSALVASKYMDVIKVLEAVGGAFVLTGLFLPLGLVILMPILVNIALYDFLLVEKPGLGQLFLVLGIFLIIAYRAYFYSLFAIGAKPGGSHVRA